MKLGEKSHWVYQVGTSKQELFCTKHQNNKYKHVFYRTQYTKLQVHSRSTLCLFTKKSYNTFYEPINIKHSLKCGDSPWQHGRENSIGLNKSVKTEERRKEKKSDPVSGSCRCPRIRMEWKQELGAGRSCSCLVSIAMWMQDTWRERERQTEWNRKTTRERNVTRN